MKLSLVCAVVLGLCGAVRAGVGIDGDFSDWSGVSNLTTDSGGDASGFVDVTWVKAQNEGAILYLHFDTGTIANFQSGSGSQGTQVLRLDVPNGETITFDFRDRRFERDGNYTPWTTVNFAGAPTFADDEFEMRFDLSGFGAAPGTNVTISMSGSDSVASVVYTMTTADPPKVVRDSDREAGTSFRIASQNTLQTGLLDNAQGPRLESIIDAVKADIYAFQEEWDSSTSQISSVIESVDPFGDGANWNVVKESGTAVASRSPIVQLPQSNTRHVATVVDLPTGPVVVMCVHLKCCGYFGSSEDSQRISQTNQIVGTVNSLRAGTLGAQYVQYQDAPVVVVGDWNLVGSRSPLTLFESNAALVRADVRHLVGEDIYTWRNSGSSFTPGYLDLVAYDDSVMVIRNTFVLDSDELSPAQLSHLGLTSNASDASDHLCVVADFEMNGAGGCGGDANGDSAVDVNDISYVLFRLGEMCPSICNADVNSDGAVDVNDISYVLFRLGDPCP